MLGNAVKLEKPFPDWTWHVSGLARGTGIARGISITLSLGRKFSIWHICVHGQGEGLLGGRGSRNSGSGLFG